MIQDANDEHIIKKYRLSSTVMKAGLELKHALELWAGGRKSSAFKDFIDEVLKKPLFFEDIKRNDETLRDRLVPIAEAFCARIIVVQCKFKKDKCYAISPHVVFADAQPTHVRELWVILKRKRTDRPDFIVPAVFGDVCHRAETNAKGAQGRRAQAEPVLAGVRHGGDKNQGRQEMSELRPKDEVAPWEPPHSRSLRGRRRRGGRLLLER